MLLLIFFGGYDLYIIAIISPLEPERAAEARSAVVASCKHCHNSSIFCGVDCNKKGRCSLPTEISRVRGGKKDEEFEC